MSHLVVVSNRVAGPNHGKGAEGGLAVALRGALKENGGLWFGWSGKVAERPSPNPHITGSDRITYATVDLTESDYDEYYNGFANSVLWPLFHYRLDLMDFSRRSLNGYQRVNSLFAQRLVPLLKPDDLVWVHDYHLIPMAEQLRQAGCKQRIGFFLHVPWPAVEVLLALPNHAELVRSLCAFDLIGFQTNRDLQSFIDYISVEANGRIGDGGLIEVHGRRTRAAAFPISTDPSTLAEYARKSEKSPAAQRLKRSVGERSLIIGVDRLDYSKGLINRMEAFSHLLERYPANRSQVVLLQIASPTREGVQEYDEIRHELEAISGHVNGTYADYDWVPIRYLNKGFTQRTLAGFFRLARVGLVTPLRDGMNLVAKEYVAAQSPRDPGVLVLSRFAGAAEELDGALIVNPYDTEGLADILETALTMPAGERKERWRGMMQHLRRNDITAWRKRFVAALDAAAPVQ
ncbi:MAG: alpha,alpha-trehalose-phosphate synthase (UDP-forming) [Alphaproteobacteria bacterium]|nr:alpha,alpha-trehalose-phosphate synthase (UDP-forming) [Alphaproteobacteria bacterium]